MGVSPLAPYVLADEDCFPSIIAYNNTGATLIVTISITFEEISARNPSLGLTASTLIEETTEMSLYG